MSGTSVDGIDACCAKFWVETGQLRFEILGTHTHKIPEDLVNRLLVCMTDRPVALAELCELNMLVGEEFAAATQGLLAAYSLKPETINAVGSHGQTLYHLPPGRAKVGGTLQIGEPSVIAERTGITTVADFRPRDMAAGGHGAPLVPFADVLLLQHPTQGRAIQNIGGIANVTVLPSVGQGDPFAFDTGPGNMLIDRLMWQRFELPYDAEGARAATGQVNERLLTQLQMHVYLEKAPPKTTGHEDFGYEYFRVLSSSFSGIKSKDILATMTFHTAKTIVDAYERFVFPKTEIAEVIIGGGGLYNRTMMGYLQTLLNQNGRSITLKSHEDYGIPSKFKEALAFAMLAWANLEGIPNNVPTCTGASRAVVMGKVISP